MAVRKIKASWWVDLRVDRRRYRKRSPENTKAGAEAYEAAIRHKLARGEPIQRAMGAPAQKQTFKQFAATWLADYVAANNRCSEQLSKKYALSSSLIPFFGRMAIDEITAHDIERYKAHQVRTGYTSKTIRNRLTVLNKCLGTAYEWLNLPAASPKIKWPRCASYRTDYLSPEECELLLGQAHGVVYEMVLTALRTGMRQGELKGLQWSSIDWPNRSVAVRHSLDDHLKELVPPKNNRERHIPLDIDVYAMLHRRKQATGYVFRQQNGKPFNKDRMGHAMRTLCRRAGLRTIGWHTLRHTFASHLAMRGVPVPAIKELLGHSSITTTMRYAHLAPSTLRMAIDMLNPKTAASADFGQPVGNPWQEIQRREIGKQYPTENYA